MNFCESIFSWRRKNKGLVFSTASPYVPPKPQLKTWNTGFWLVILVSITSHVNKAFRYCYKICPCYLATLVPSELIPSTNLGWIMELWIAELPVQLQRDSNPCRLSPQDLKTGTLTTKLHHWLQVDKDQNREEAWPLIIFNNCYLIKITLCELICKRCNNYIYTVIFALDLPWMQSNLIVLKEFCQCVQVIVVQNFHQ